MPITRRQFELEIDIKTEEWMDKIEAFLAEHKDEAFTEEDLRQHYRPILLGLLSEQEKRRLQVIGGKGDPFAILPDEKRAFDLALEKLVEIQAAEKRIFRDTHYYAYNKDLPF